MGTKLLLLMLLLLLLLLLPPLSLLLLLLLLLESLPYLCQTGPSAVHNDKKNVRFIPHYIAQCNFLRQIYTSLHPSM